MEAEVTKPKNKGGRPRKQVDVSAALQLPEVQAAIAAAAKASAREMFAELAATAQTPAVAASTGADDLVKALTSVFDRMGLSFADIADQGSSRVRVAPEEMEKRKNAVTRMGELLMEAYDKGLVPEYELITKAHIKDQLIEPFQDVDGVAVPTVIYWQGPPGPAFRPVNDIARLIFEQYSISIGGIADTTNGVSNQPQWVMLGKTNGLTVKTTAGARFRDGGRGAPRQLGGMADSDAPLPPTESGPGFAFKRPVDHRAPTFSVLGSVVPPARNISVGERRN